ncbi:MAG: response regulator [Cyclobacteriaceae bacterium]|nr:response regulator [Cyclobacteriaceae bacterium]
MSKVLLVDDEEDICLLLSGILKREGFKTSYALNLENAKEMLSQEEFAAAFIDLNLPDGIGSELIPIIKEMRTDTKIIMISAYDMGLVKASKEGADYLIKKPFSRNIILTAIAELQID